ncbi:MAG: hypothetical protein IJG45_00495 [Oscillospiraceae bacterium]|nr:hypothetical protein [Oscillospiraceae bacterium]
MPDYEKMYYRFYNAITDALEYLEAGELQTARFLLIRAQQEAEELYLAAEG